MELFGLSVCFWSNEKLSKVLKRVFTQKLKSCHYLLNLMLFQTRMTFILLCFHDTHLGYQAAGEKIIVRLQYKWSI